MTKEEMIEELKKFPSKDIRKLAGVSDTDCDAKAVATKDDFPAEDFIIGSETKADNDDNAETGVTDDLRSLAEKEAGDDSSLIDSKLKEFVSQLDTTSDNKITYYVAKVPQSEANTIKLSDISFKKKTAKIGTKLDVLKAGTDDTICFIGDCYDLNGLSTDRQYVIVTDGSLPDMGDYVVSQYSNVFKTVSSSYANGVYLADGCYILVIEAPTVASN